MRTYDRSRFFQIISDFKAVQKHYETELQDITHRFDRIKRSLGDKVDMLRGECEELRSKAKSYEDALLRDTDTRVQAALAPFISLPAEIDSLRTVLSMRNDELRELRQNCQVLQKQLEELPAAKEKNISLEQQLENLQAIVQMKTEYERHLSERYQTLQRRLDQESRDNKRLSHDNEELHWRLSQSDLSDPMTASAPGACERTADLESPLMRSPLTRSGRRRPVSHHGGAGAVSPRSPRRVNPSTMPPPAERSLSQPEDTMLILDEVIGDEATKSSG